MGARIHGGRRRRRLDGERQSQLAPQYPGARVECRRSPARKSAKGGQWRNAVSGDDGLLSELAEGKVFVGGGSCAVFGQPVPAGLAEPPGIRMRSADAPGGGA